MEQPPGIATIGTTTRSPAELVGDLEIWGAHIVVDGRQPFTAALDAARGEGEPALIGRALSMAARAELFWGGIQGSLALAEQAIAQFEQLDEDMALRLAGPHAEAWRVIGNARLKLGEIAAALPPLERAVAVAERGVEAAVIEASPIRATSALVSSLNNLAVALMRIRETAGAAQVLHRALDVVDAHPRTQDDVPDDVVFIACNLADVKLMEARDRQVAGEDISAQIAEARQVLDGRVASMVARRGADGNRVSVLAERDFIEALGRIQLMDGQLDAALAQFQKLVDGRVQDRSRGATGASGLAETLLALGRPAEALDHARRALAAYDMNEEVGERAGVLEVLSRIHRALGQHRDAFDCLEEHNRLRRRLDVLATRQYAVHMAARIGLERARAEADAQRRIANELAALNHRLVEQAAILEAQAEALGVARTVAEEASRAKSAFLANMSHELRTPLNAILGFAEMLRDGYGGPPGPSWSGYAGMIHEAGSHLLKVIGEILDLSKIEAGRVMLSIETVDAQDVLDSCVELMAPHMERNRLDFVVSCDPTVTAFPADALRLKQILLNLLSNAAKFTDPGGRVSLTVGRAEAAESVEIRVADTGIGMTAVEVQLALEVFGQVESGTARKHQGSGLGLPIAVGLAELHGGSLHVLSEKGVGTEVVVRLPLRPAQEFDPPDIKRS